MLLEYSNLKTEFVADVVRAYLNKEEIPPIPENVSKVADVGEITIEELGEWEDDEGDKSRSPIFDAGLDNALEKIGAFPVRSPRRVRRPPLRLVYKAGFVQTETRDMASTSV